MRVTKIQDFGNKIGGARKDFYTNGIHKEDLSDMEDLERNKNLTKNKVWGKVDYQQMVDEGKPKIVVYFIKKLKDTLPTKPINGTLAEGEKYVDYINTIKESLYALNSEDDIKRYYSSFVLENLVVRNQVYRHYTAIDKYENYLNNKFFRATQISSIERLKKEMEKKEFLFSDKDKLNNKVMKAFQIYKYPQEVFTDIDYNYRNTLGIRLPNGVRYIYPTENDDFKKLVEGDCKEDTYVIMNGKTILASNIDTLDRAKEMAEQLYLLSERIKKEVELQKPTDKIPYLTSLERKGPDYIKNQTVTTDILQEKFNFYGGEFGNYESAKDRKKNIELSYDAFCDLARALNISIKDVTFGGKLSIAYGARGRGGKNAALAHYEPYAKVINLTKLKGAGSLAHEWGHALDNHLFNITHPGEEERMNIDALKNADNYLSNSRNSELNELLNTMCFTLEPRFNSPDPFINKWGYEAIGNRNEIMNYVLYDHITSDNREEVENALKKFQDVPLSSEDLKKYSDNNIFPESFNQLQNDLQSILNVQIDSSEALSIITDQKLLTDRKEESKNEFYKKRTKFVKDAVELDSYFHPSKSYYSTNHELFARAFACYVTDKLKVNDEKNDYLCGHADIMSFKESLLSGKASPDGKENYISAAPQGEEREQINQMFDKFFEKLKEMEIFHDFDEQEAYIIKNAIEKEFSSNHSGIEPLNVERYDNYSQLSLFEMEMDER